MKSLILILITINSFSQDSVSLKVTRVKSFDDKKIFFLRDKKIRYKTICPCMAKFKKGDVIVFPKTELDNWMMYGIIPRKLKL